MFLIRLDGFDCLEMIFVYIIGVFELQKSQMVQNCQLGSHRKLLHTTWLLLVYLVLVLYYNVEVHTMLIAKEYTKVPMKLSDLEFPRDYVIRFAAVKWLGN